LIVEFFTPMLSIHHRRSIICALGITQTIAWASTYYLPAILAPAMAKSLGTSTTVVFVAFTIALIVSGITGALIGRVIDKQGGRGVLMASSMLFVIGLFCLSKTQSVPMLFGAWLIVGIGMGMGLYDPAFSTLVRLFGKDARGAITGVTLFGGFASTIGWPLSHYFQSEFGWQGACIGWAAIHLLIGFPFNALLPKLSADSAANLKMQETGSNPAETVTVNKLDFALVAYSFASFSFITAAYATHFPRLLGLLGMSAAAAVAIGSLFGPAQVAARIAEFSFLRRFDALNVAKITAVFHPLGALVICILGPMAASSQSNNYTFALAAFFAVMHGVCNGMMTISKGAVPLALFGAQGFGKRQGYIALACTFAQATAPIGFGLAVDRLGVNAFLVSMTLASFAFASLIVLAGRGKKAVRSVQL
jgi:MFS family permease